jgi:hypothetical protein
VTVLSPPSGYNCAIQSPICLWLHEEIALMQTARLTVPSRIPPRTRWPAVLALAATGAALLIAGCGGSPSPSTGTSAQSIKDPVSAAFKFSACMRQHGMTNFPDPVVKSSPGQQSIGLRVTPGIARSHQFQSAQKACRSIMPGPSKADIAAQAQQQRAHTQGLLRFARCLRRRGINNFPDPDAQGNLTPQILSAAGIDVHAPSVLAAARACIPESEGQVNAAAIQQAANSGS